MLIVVTGAAGFIGSNIVKELNRRGHYDIIAVDNLTNGEKCRNLADLDILDFVDKEDFYKLSWMAIMIIKLIIFSIKVPVQQPLKPMDAIL